MPASNGLRDRLLHHDCRIAINTARAHFPGWRDRLTAGVILFFAMASARAWFGDQPWKIAAWAAVGAGILVGVSAGRLVAVRIAFHSFDGVLAADALHPSIRRRYMVAWHGVGIAALAAITLIIRPSLLIVSMPAYLAGALVAWVPFGLAPKVGILGRAALGWNVRRQLHRPRAAVIAATILLLSLIPAQALGTKGLIAVVGIEAVVFAVMLTTVDQRIVRFMIIAGHRPWRIVIRHSKALLFFTGLTVPVCWAALGPVAAGIVAVASLAMLLLLAMRVLAYCAHDKRFADLLVSICAGLLLLVAYWMLVLLPFVAIAVLWQLQRRAAARRWLLA